MARRAASSTTKKTYNLPPELVARAQSILGARTETETIIRSLEAVAEEEDIHRAIRRVSAKLPGFGAVR